MAASDITLNLKKFNITTISSDSVVVFIGKRRTGKSFLIKDLIYYHRHIPIGTVISGTESANRFYGDFMPSIFIHDEYQPGIISNVIKRQQVIKRKFDKDPNIDPNAFMILDDCLYDSSWTRDKNVRCLFMNGRHFNILFAIAMQFPLGIPPNLRTNIDYVFILRENNINNRRRIYENYASMFPTFEVFCTVMDQCTENHECLVLQINSNSNKLEDQVFWYKAQSHEDDDFKIGCKDFWVLSAEKEEEKRRKQDAEGEMIDISCFRPKKSIPLQVKQCGKVSKQ
jgi:hypothetical protein